MRQLRQRFIDAGTGIWYYIIVVTNITVPGGMYVFNLLTPYDPSVIAADPRLIYWTYALGFAGGIIITIGWFLAPWNSLASLLIQRAGLYAQLAAVAALALIVAPAGAISAYILSTTITTGIGHTYQLRHIQKQRYNAPTNLAVENAL